MSLSFDPDFSQIQQNCDQEILLILVGADEAWCVVQRRAEGEERGQTERKKAHFSLAVPSRRVRLFVALSESDERIRPARRKAQRDTTAKVREGKCTFSRTERTNPTLSIIR